MQEAGTRAALLLQSAGNIAGKALQGQSSFITDTLYRANTVYKYRYKY